MADKETRGRTDDLQHLEQDLNQMLERYQTASDNIWQAVDCRAKEKKADADRIARRQASFRRMLWAICMVLACIVAVLFYQTQLGILG